MKSVPRIVMLASANHTAFDTRIFQKEARSLIRAGYSVSIVVPADRSEVVDGIEIIAVKRPANGFVKLMFSPWRIFLKATDCTGNCIFHIHDSELLFMGLCLRLLGKKVIYDAHEDTPQQINYQPWIPVLFRRPYAWLYRLIEWLVGQTFTAIIIAEPIISRYFPARKTTLLRNFPDVALFGSVFVPYGERRGSLIYAGSLTRARGLDTMLAASALLARLPHFEFLLAGSFFPPALENSLQGHAEVRYVRWIMYPELVRALGESKVGILVPLPLERYKTNYPVKLFEYMLAGIPVVVSKYGEIARFVTEEHCGLLVEPTSPQEIASAVETLLNNPTESEMMGLRGKHAVLKKYNWELEQDRLISLYRRLDTDGGRAVV